MAVVPQGTTAPFTVVSGTATWNGAGTTGTINASNRAVLNWVTDNAATTSNFTIATGETFNFVLPDSGSAVLNRVGSPAIIAATNPAAQIDGSLLSNGRVVILANGNIIVGSGAQISTGGGLVLSTLTEDNFTFTATGNLLLNGASTGGITLGTTGTSVATVVGNLAAHAGSVTINNLTVSGSFLINSTSTSAVSLTGSGGNTTVGSNLTVNSSGGAISQGTGSLLVSNGHTALATSGAGGTISLGTVTNDFQTVSLNTTTLTGNAAIADANNVILNASNIGGDLSVTAVGTAGNRSISSNGTLTIGGNATFTQTGGSANSAINIAHNSTVGGALSFSAVNANATFNGAGNLRLGNETAAIAGATIGPGAFAGLFVTTNGTLTVAGDVSVTGAGGDRGHVTLTAGSIIQTADASISTTAGDQSVVMNATSGSITVGNITNGGEGGISLRTAGGSITQLGGTTLSTTDGGSTSTFNATTSGAVNLLNANTFADDSILQVTAGTATINNTGGDLQLGTTNVANNLNLTNGAGNLMLGTGVGTGAQNITVGGTLTANVTGANITDNPYTAFNIFGGLNLNTGGGNVSLTAGTANGALAPNVQLGQIRVNASTGGVAPFGDVTISERSTVNLGLILADDLSVTSTQGSIINTGDLNVTGTANFTTMGAATTVITNGTNSFGTVNLMGSGGAVTAGSTGLTLGAATNVTSGDDVLLTTTGGGNITLAGPTIGGHLTVNSSGTIATVAGTNTTVGGNLTLNAADAGASSIVQGGSTGRFVVTGTTNVAAGGNVTLDAPNDFTGEVVLNQPSSTGNVVVSDQNNLTISGRAGGNVTATAGAPGGIAAPWNLVLGNLNVAGFTAVSGNGGGGNSGTLTQLAGTSLHVENTFRGVVRNSNIVLTNNGNSAGRVEFFTNGATGNGSGTISYTEDGTIRVGNLAANSNITLRSNFGSIQEDNNAAVLINSRATLNATAPNGSILLGGTTNNNTTTANIATLIASAPSGAVAVTGNANIVLNSVNANSLSVVAQNNITQTNAITVFGTSNFTSLNSADTDRHITLTNAANNFGPVSVATGIGNTSVSITENATLNLRRALLVGGGNGTFTATSLNGDIIDTGLGGLVLGGNSTSPGSGVVTLSAANGNIIIDDPTSNFLSTTGVVFNGRDVTLSILGNVTSQVTLGAASAPSQATGNLTVSTALGSIGNAGTFTVGGTAFFQAPNGSIAISQPGVGFGQLRFIGNQVSIAESGNMDILTGSASFGNANLVSGGSIAIVNVGGLVTFGSAVNMQATGNITLPKLIQAAGLLTLSHTGTADLGALSIAGDLGGITPIDNGTGPYVPPQP